MHSKRKTAKPTPLASRRKTGLTRIAAGLALLALCLPAPVLAGQTITIDSAKGSMSAPVVYFGNSSTNPHDGNTLPANPGADIVDLDPNGNTIIVTRTGSLTGMAVGGYAITGGSTGNKIEISGDVSVMNLTGGMSKTDASRNTIVINSGTITGDAIIGGAAYNDDAVPVSANDNHIIIKGGTITGGIVAGWAQSAALSGNTANDNAISIYGTPDLSGAILVGTIGASQPSRSVASGPTGNALNLYTPVSISGVMGFQNYNFYLPATFTTDGTMLTILDAPNMDMSGTTVNVGVQRGRSPLQVGDVITLVEMTDGTLDASDINELAAGEGMVGISKGFTFELAATDEKLSATVLTIANNEQVKSLVESRIAGLGMLTQGGDMLAGQAIPQLRSTAATSGQAGLVPFGVMGGSAMRYNSGSHVDVDGFNLVTGLGYNTPLGGGSTLLTGAFFEAGWGSYDTHNSFSGEAFKGSGNTNYYGGGLLARYDSSPLQLLNTPGSLYAETSVRAGRVKTDYDSSDFLTASGGNVNVDSSAMYYGAHAGLGYIWNIGEKTTLDTYTKYLWTHQDSDSVSVEGDRIRFKKTDSHRARVGAKLAHTMKNTKSDIVFTPYVGVAYEREFDGKARGTTNGDAIDAPSVRGNTGIGEVGFTFKPSAASRFSMDLGMQGHTGKREGLSGSLQIKFTF